jgi:hypothetical protein
MTMPHLINDEERQARHHFAQGDFAKAEVFFRRLAQAAPRDPLAQYNLGVTLGKLDRLEEAMSFYRLTIELNPVFADAYINFGTCLNELNLTTQARKGFALARQITPDNPIPILNEGLAALAMGDYAAGWKDFAARWQLPVYEKFKRNFSQPTWNGEDLAGKTLFLFAEQGFGDTLQMARYIPLLTAKGAKVILESPPALTRLLRHVQGSPHVITKGEDIPDFDFYCSMMDIPRAFGTVLETVPAAVPYLYADDTEIAFYRDLSPHKAARRIGLSWAGRTSHENDRNRSLSFSQTAPLLAQENIEWISLQRVVTDRDAQDIASSRIVDWGKDFSDFASAAAAVMALDLVITVDTAIAHLAGALGKPVWILLPFYADWRWLKEREDSPWYPTARLFRQKERKNWTEVIERVSEEATAYSNAAP